MGTITKLERQQHDNKRVSVFLNDVYACSVSDELIVLEHLTLGREIEAQELNQLLREDEKKRALSKGCAYIARCEKTEKQVRTYLASKAFSPEAVDEAVDRLTELGYLNDRELCRAFVDAHPSRSVRELAGKLRMKGASQELVQEALETVCDEDQVLAATRLAEKNKRKYASLPPREGKAKLAASLARKGFSWETISQALKGLEDE